MSADQPSFYKNLDPRETELPKPSNIHFERYIPLKSINPIDMVGQFGLDLGEGDKLKAEFARKYGTTILFEDEPHERGTRAIELGIRAVRNSQIAPDIIFVVSSHLPDPDKSKTQNPQHVANILRSELERRGLVDVVKATPQNTRTVSAACSGYLVALHELHKLNISDGQSVLVVDDESNYRETLPPPGQDSGKGGLLFTDIVVSKQFLWGTGIKVLSTDVKTYGDPDNLLRMRRADYDPNDPFVTVYNPPYSEHFDMVGAPLMRFFPERITDDVIEELIHAAGKKRSDLKFFFSHQASIRMVNAFNKQFDDIPVKSDNLKKYGNTSSASTILSLEDAINDGLIGKGDSGLLLAYGAGLTWGAAVIEL
ncbi:MAG TPA: 3-oxoacyl-[acyl-carrier-protein] synthase III C-terminal domain-containing protein [Patescibacteria group bacterium]|nr:3-oxoacyl-[acyl-carrier-protein] synthase III C-terminal domain-containing protein [Patescibacteria group bacterium]